MGYDNIIDVTDTTNFKKFWLILAISFWATLDSILWSFTNCLIVFVFAVIGLLSNLCSNLFPRDLQYSDVNRIDPEIHTKYAEKLKNKGYWRILVEKLKRNSPEFDFDLAEFHLQLAALAYEPKNVVNDVLRSWPSELGLDFCRFGNEGCCILAVWSEKHEFVDLAFKGTSPYDLTEWLIDFTIQKNPAKNGTLPGLVHSGFYNVFGFPNTEIFENNSGIVKDLGIGTNKTSHTTEVGPIGNKVSQTNLWNTILYPEFQKIVKIFESANKKPNLWITGHSLGAATATVFTSMVLWRGSSIGKSSPMNNVDWNKKFKLCGTYTYGNPRVGDKDWFNAITEVLKSSYQFHRVINANDIVCTIPTTIFRTTFSNKMNSDSQAGITLSDFNHLGNPVRLPYRRGTIDKTERTQQNILENIIAQIISTPSQLLQGTLLARVLVFLNLLTLGTVGFIRDHTPSEYLKNLDAARPTL